MTANTCPSCGGPLESPKLITHMQRNGIPRSVKVCATCWRSVVGETRRHPSTPPAVPKLAMQAKVVEVEPAITDLPLFALAEA